jgi:hypothetical protein
MVYLVILVGLASSLATSVLDRRRGLAIVRAIGSARRWRGGWSCSSLIIGGWARLACVGGMVLATMWVSHTFQLLLGWALDVQILARAGSYPIATLGRVLSRIAGAGTPRRDARGRRGPALRLKGKKGGTVHGATQRRFVRLRATAPSPSTRPCGSSSALPRDDPDAPPAVAQAVEEPDPSRRAAARRSRGSAAPASAPTSIAGTPAP